LASRPRHRRAAAAAAADDRRDLLDHVSCREPRGNAVVEVRHEGDGAVLARPEDDCRRRAALLEAVGEGEQRLAPDRRDLPHADAWILYDADLGLDLDLRLLLPRLLGVAPRLLELGPDGVELPRTSVEHRPRLAGRDRLDATRAGADRSLGDDHERPDLGGRPHVRAAAEL